MSRFLDLPAALPAATIKLGQLISDPLSTDSASLQPSQEIPTTQTVHDDASEYPGLQYHMLKPIDVFNKLRQDSTTRSFLRKMAYQNKPVYLVTGVQALQNPSTESQHRMAVRRVDSASNLNMPTPPATPNCDEKPQPQSVIAVELREVKCRIGAPSEPHCIADVHYDWSYHRLDDEDEDMQLSIGLGKVVKAEDLLGHAGREEETRERAAGHWGRRGPAVVEGLGGF